MARLQVDNEKVFDSVIVVTDRNVLDAQLQDAIKQIDNDQGIVVAIDSDEAASEGGSKSGLLAKALTGRKADHRRHDPDVPVRDGRNPAEQGTQGQDVRGDRRRGAFIAVRAGRCQAARRC